MVRKQAVDSTYSKRRDSEDRDGSDSLDSDTISLPPEHNRSEIQLFRCDCQVLKHPVIFTIISIYPNTSEPLKIRVLCIYSYIVNSLFL